MNELEQRLSADLRDVAGTSVPTPTPPAVLRARGDAADRRRTRGVLAGAAAAVVLAAITTGLTLGRGDDPQITPAPAPTKFYDDGVPYVLEGRLYISHEEQLEPGRWMTPTIVGRYARVYNVDYGTTLFLRDSEEVYRTALITGPSIVSADGVAAWVQEFGPNGILTAYDLETGKILTRARIPIPRGVGEDADTEAIELTSVDADGTVHYQLFYARGDGFDRAWKVGPGPDAQPRRDPDGVGDEVVLDEEGPPGFPDGVFARLSPDHLWGAWLSDDGLVVQAPDRPGTRFTIRVPAAMESGFVTWSDLTHVELVHPEAPDLTCDTAAKKCHTADQDS